MKGKKLVPEKCANGERERGRVDGQKTMNKRRKSRAMDIKQANKHIPKREQNTDPMNRGGMADWNNFGINQ